MGKAIIAFIVLSVLVGGAIGGIRAMNGKQRWSLVKMLGYGAMCSIIAFSILFSFVIIF